MPEIIQLVIAIDAQQVLLNLSLKNSKLVQGLYQLHIVSIGIARFHHIECTSISLQRDIKKALDSFKIRHHPPSATYNNNPVFCTHQKRHQKDVIILLYRELVLASVAQQQNDILFGSPEDSDGLANIRVIGHQG